MADEKKTAPASKLRLTLHWDYHPRDELAVVHSEHGAPIPFTWIDHETLEIDDIFGDVVTIQYAPKTTCNAC